MNFGSSERNDDICVICLEVPTLKVHPNVCQHVFCGQCLFRWTRVMSTCPLCKRYFHGIELASNLRRETRYSHRLQLINLRRELQLELEQRHNENNQPSNEYNQPPIANDDEYSRNSVRTPSINTLVRRVRTGHLPLINLGSHPNTHRGVPQSHSAALATMRIREILVRINNRYNPRMQSDVYIDSEPQLTRNPPSP